MKKLFAILAAVLLTASGFLPQKASAQAPEKMSYQAVIRDIDDNLVTNQTIGMQINILQGSATGTAVYVETQTPATNANGLVSIEIGNGTVVSGDFTTIDWTNGPYFIKTETDPTGGTSYTISGTSQLLSVPYALHAKTADSVTGTINETDPVFGASVASGITATDTAYWNNHTDSTDIVNLGFVAGPHTDSTDIANMGFLAGGTYSVGDFAQGGIVFWLDETKKHGLACAKEDQSGGTPMRWYAGTFGNTQAKGDGPLAGEMNTSIIIASQVAIGDDGATYAARICSELQVIEGGLTYGDWYFPSKEELNLMYQNKATIDSTATANGGSSFASHVYWSSKEVDSEHAWMQGFVTGGQFYNPKYYPGKVRAIRVF
jgi:hypothetical protein